MISDTITAIISILALLYKDNVISFVGFVKVYFTVWVLLITFIVKSWVYLLEPNDVPGYLQDTCTTYEYR